MSGNSSFELEDALTEYGSTVNVEWTSWIIFLTFKPQSIPHYDLIRMFVNLCVGLINYCIQNLTTMTSIVLYELVHNVISDNECIIILMDEGT